MGTPMIFYLVSVAVSLYAAWLFSFRTYRMKYVNGDYRPTDERIVYPRVIYLLAFSVSFLPVVNTMIAVVFVIAAMVGRSCGYFCVKSWLLEEPGQKEKDDEKE